MLSRKRLSHLAAPLVLYLLACAMAMAQSPGATLSGTILDQNGAVIPSVTITVLNKTTGLERRMATTEDGSFSFPLLPSGEYVLTAQREGFATVKVPDLNVSLNERRSIRLQLRVGNINGVVDIVLANSIIQWVGTSAVVIDRQFISSLPLNSRSLQPVIALEPGVVVTGADSDLGLGQISVNGQRSNANYYTVDGVSANIGIGGSTPGQGANGSIPGFDLFGGTNGLVSVDAVQEVKIQTSSYAAEFGRVPGAQVQITTRSGGNQFHGSIFEYFGSDALNAADYFARSNILPGSQKPPFRDNRFGGVAGGPVIKDRTFFFVSYEAFRFLQPRSVVTEVPSIESRNTAPLRLRPFLNAYPLPNAPASMLPFLGSGFGVFAAEYSDPSKLNATSVRVDHTAKSNLTIFGRLDISDSESSGRGGTIQGSVNSFLGAVSSNIALLTQNTNTVTVGSIWLASPTIANELLVNYSNFEISRKLRLDSFGGAIPLPDSSLFPASISSSNGSFSFAIAGTGSLTVGNLLTDRQRQINIIDNLSVAVSTHQLKMGVDYRRLYPVFRAYQYAQSLFFNGLGSAGDPADPGTVESGIVASGLVQSSDPGSSTISNLSLYAQDTWKARNNLTLTYGLRWEFNPSPVVDYGHPSLNLIDPNGTPQLVLGPQIAPLYRTTYGNYAPRVGLALHLGGKNGHETMLRAGAGLFYDLGYGSGGPSSAFTNSRFKSFTNVPFPLSPEVIAPIPGNIDPDNLNINNISALYLFDSKIRTPRTYEWNLAVEQSLGQNQVLSLRYVGAAGRSLIDQLQILVPLNPSGSVVADLITNGGSSNYNAFQLQFQRRLSRGLQFLASYTLGHSTDNVSSDFPDRGASSKGPSDFDVRHSFTSALSYALPGSDSGPLSSRFFKDWSIDLISLARSALPVNVSLPPVFAVSQNARPDLVPGQPLYIIDPTSPGGKRINRAAFDFPTQGNGNLGRNALRGFPAWQIDLGLHRQLTIREHLKLQIRAEAYNIFNHPNFANPLSTIFIINDFPIGPNPFGQPNQTLAASLGGGTIGGLTSMSQIGGPRSVKLSLRLLF